MTLDIKAYTKSKKVLIQFVLGFCKLVSTELPMEYITVH